MVYKMGLAYAPIEIEYLRKKQQYINKYTNKYMFTKKRKNQGFSSVA